MNEVSSFPVFVISLAGSPRRAFCSKELAEQGIDFSFFDAVDGRTLNKSTSYALSYGADNEKYFKRSLSPEEIGCYLSHGEIWRRAAESGETIVVFEDDAQFSPQLGYFLGNLQQYDLSNFIVKLGGLSKCVYFNKTLAQIGDVKILEFSSLNAGTVGYVIGAEAARQMILTRQQFGRPIDIDIKHLWEHGVSVLGVEPHLIRETSSIKGSDIHESRRASKNKNALLRFMKNILYQMRYRSQRWIHRTNYKALDRLPMSDSK